MLERIKEDFFRHGGTVKSPAFWAVAVYRFGRWSDSLRLSPMRWMALKIYGAAFLGIELATGIVLNREAEIGEELHIIHSGNIKIHPHTVIGDRCGIMHDVTLGTNMERDGAPTLGNDVFIGAGAKVLGPVTIGNGARVAANSLVINDVPPMATAIGVPARIMRYTGRADDGPKETSSR